MMPDESYNFRGLDTICASLPLRNSALVLPAKATQLGSTTYECLFRSLRQGAWSSIEVTLERLYRSDHYALQMILIAECNGIALHTHPNAV